MQVVRSIKQENATAKTDGPRVAARDLFAVPVVVCQWPEAEQLNAQLREIVMERFKSTPGVVVSNRNGWHSETDLHKWPEPCIAELLEMMQTAASKMVAHIAPGTNTTNWQIPVAWANVNPAGGHNRAHNHINGGGQLSGVYYVDIGECTDPGASGRLVFEDRSGAAQPKLPGRNVLSREYALTPSPGTMVIFPAAQYHYVEPYRGNGVRISIAFNLHHPDFETLYYPEMLETGWWRTNFRGLTVIREKIPEKMRALQLFASYAVREMGQAGKGKAPLFSRLKSALSKAQADASAEAEGTHQAAIDDGRLAEKKPLV